MVKKSGIFDEMISVIIPVYNVEKFLRRCLDSVKSQTFSDFEAILIDDGSIDGSGRICDEYAGSDERFRVVHQANQGVSSARNLGLDLAQGEYIYFADSDDELLPETLERLFAAIRQGDYDVAASGYSIVRDGVETGMCFTAGAPPKVYSGDEVLVKFLRDCEFVCYTCWNKLINRRLISDLRFMDIKQEDFMFCGQLSLKLDSVIYLNESLYRYFDRPASISKDFSYIGPHQSVAVLARLIEETPRERANARALILSRLLVRLMTSSYFISISSLSHEEKEAYKVTCRTLFRRYAKEFFCHPAIPLKRKAEVVVGKLFPWLMGKYLDKLEAQAWK